MILTSIVLSTSSRKPFFGSALYTEEVNLQTFVMIELKTICCNYLCTKIFILVIGFQKIEHFLFFPYSKNEYKLCTNL